jgi:hypothetical protein
MSSPTELFWYVVNNLGLAPWVFKAGCALVALVYVYRLPRQWEHLPLMIGLGCIVASPFLPPAGPAGDWLVYPSVAILIARNFYRDRWAIEAERQREHVPAGRILLKFVRGHK